MSINYGQVLELVSAKSTLILASGSPRRKELLSYLNLPFEILVSNTDESFSLAESPDEIAKRLSLKKGIAVSESITKSSFIIAADTIVVLDNEILGKPENIAQAETFLKKLSGKQHQVITGFCFLSNLNSKNNKWNHHCFSESSMVEFEEIDPILLSDYLKTRESLDKAGAYGIQGASLPFVKEIRGSYSNIVGLPINRVHQEMVQLLGKDLKKIFK